MRHYPGNQVLNFSHSSSKSFPRVSLCFSGAFCGFGLAGAFRVGGGVPTVARAADFTAFTTSNFFNFFFLAISAQRYGS